MNPPEFSTGDPSPPSSKKELQLQGPRPPPLKISKESHKIKKPPLPPPPTAHNRHHAPPQQREPVVIYSVSPRVIHVNSPRDFRDIVQRLTGMPRADEPPAGPGDVSPAARLASIEKTSPPMKERGSQSRDDDMTQMSEGVEMGQFPGIISPAPGTLPMIPSRFFSPPAMDPQTASFYNEFWSPSSFLGSPSGFLSVPDNNVSPRPSPNPFSDFSLFD